jgi:transglutaminase-like putative cysteine protease
MVTRLLRAGAVPLLLIGMLTLAGVTAGRVYSGQLLTLLTVGAAIGSVMVSVLLSRAPAWLIAPLSTAGLLGYLTFCLIYSAKQAGVPADLMVIAKEALPDSIPRLLAALVPIEPQPDTIAIPVIATWLAGLASAELAVRANRMTVALCVPVLLFSAALWLVGPSAGRVLWQVLAFGGLAIAALAITGRVKTPETGVDDKTRRALRLRTTVAAALGVALILAVAVAGGPALSTQIAHKPIDPRSLITPPQLDALDENPLIRLSGWALEPKQRLFEVDAPAGTKVRLAVLSDYDGVTWRVGATYRPAGRTLPEVPGIAAKKTVQQQITIAGLRGKLLPAVASPRQINGVRVAFDQATGTVIQPDGLTEGLTYTVTSQQEQPNANLLPGAEVPDATTMARYLADNGAAYQRASAIERYLADHYKLDPQAPSGHAYPNLGFFLFKPVSYGGQKGTSEQFAASFAVLARLLNLPSRVVVGFSVPEGKREVTAGDAYAWPEIYFKDIGWVAFHPLPQSDQLPRPPEEEFKPKVEQSEPPPPSEAPIPTLAPTTVKPAGSAVALPTAGGANMVLIASAGGGGAIFLTLLIFVLIVVMGRSRLRRSRLDTGTPSERVEGAWLELSDALRLAGREAPAHLTAAEVSEHAATAALRIRGKHRVRLAAPPVSELAGAVNETEFGNAGVTPQQAEIARARALSYIDELKARRSWLRRLLWTLHPGPLRWRRKGK